MAAAGLVGPARPLRRRLDRHTYFGRRRWQWHQRWRRRHQRHQCRRRLDWHIHPRCAKEAPPRGGGAGLGAVRGPRRRQRGARPSAHRRRQVRRLTSTNDVGYTYTCPSYPSQRRLLCRPAKGAVADEVSMLVRCAAAVVALLAWRTSATSSARRQVASGSMTMARATAPHLVPRRCRSAPR